MTKGSKQLTKWKASFSNNVQMHWIFIFINVHNKISLHLNKLLTKGIVPCWISKGGTCLMFTVESKGKRISSFRPITCLQLIWKFEDYFQYIFTNSLAIDHFATREQKR